MIATRWPARARGVLLALLAASSLAGCARNDDEIIRADVQGLTLARGDAVARDAARIAERYGRRALLSIETAVHTADETGRKNLIVAIRKIGDGEAIPLLSHLSAFDADPDVRREAEWTLRGWAATDDARGIAARAALRRVEELRGREEAG